MFQDDPLTPIHKFCFFVFDFFTHFPENSEILGHSYGFSSFTEGLERVTTLQPEVGWYQNRLSRESRWSNSLILGVFMGVVQDSSAQKWRWTWSNLSIFDIHQPTIIIYHLSIYRWRPFSTTTVKFSENRLKPGSKQFGHFPSFCWSYCGKGSEVWHTNHFRIRNLAGSRTLKKATSELPIRISTILEPTTLIGVLRSGKETKHTRNNWSVAAFMTFQSAIVYDYNHKIDCLVSVFSSVLLALITDRNHWEYFKRVF